MVGAATGNTATADIRVLVVEGVAQRHRGRRVFAGVAIGQPLHDLINACCRRIAIEGDGQHTATLGVGAHRHARQLDIAARSKYQTAGRSNHIFAIAAAASGNGQRRSAPVARIKFRIGQYNIAVNLDRRAILNVIACPRRIQVRDRRRIVHRGDRHINRGLRH